MNVSKEILEAAAFMAGDDKEKQEQWITIFEKVVNKKLPMEVILNIETCEQEGEEENYLSRKEFEEILSLSKLDADGKYDYENVVKEI